MTDGRLFCFGYGFTAGRLAQRLRARGWRVAGTRRQPATADIPLYAFGPGRPLADPAAALAGVTHLLLSIPPDDAGDPALLAQGADLARAGGLRWIGYLSTTGVYGDQGGEYVDESAPTNPASPRGARRVAGEAAWRAFGRTHGIGVEVFRLAGIYGPGRSALDRLRQGTARRIDKPGQVFARIHVDDIVTVLLAAIDRPNPGAIYNVCDDEPAPQADVIAHAAGLLGIAPPPLEPFASADISPSMREFYGASRRVANGRIKRELGVTLAYPNYRAGLAACLDSLTAEAQAGV